MSIGNAITATERAKFANLNATNLCTINDAVSYSPKSFAISVPGLHPTRIHPVPDPE